MKIIIALVLCFGNVFAQQQGGSERQFRLMKSTSSAVRREAVRDIGRMRQPSSVTILSEALESDADFGVRSMAAEALGNMRSKEAVPSLAKALNDENRNVRASVIVAFGYIRDASSVKPLVEYLGKEKDLGLRLSAVNVLGVISSEEAGPVLIDLLEGQPERLSSVAAQSLGRMRHAPAVKTLMKLATKSKDESLRIAAIKALGEIRDEEAVKGLENLLKKEKAQDIKFALVYSLAQLGSDNGFDIALEAAKSEDIGVKRNGIRALGLMKKKTKEIEGIVIEAAKSSNTGLKRDAEATASYLGIKLPKPPPEK